MRGPNDMGGLPAGPIDTTAHDMTFWEKQIDAISQLLGREECGVLHSGENRRSIESLGDDVYRTLGYYERWTAGIARLLLEKNILTQDEIDRKIAQLRALYARDGKPLAEMETSAKPKVAPKAKPKANAKSKPKPKVKAKPKSKPKAKVVAKPKRKVAAKAKPAKRVVTKKKVSAKKTPAKKAKAKRARR